MTESHIDIDVSDYVLGLLSNEESHRVSSHISSCQSCRKQVEIERRLAIDVRSTIFAATQIEESRLLELMPAREDRKIGPNRLLFSRQLALAATLLIIILGSVIFQFALSENLQVIDTPSYATATNVVTQTASNTATATTISLQNESRSGQKGTELFVPALAAPIPILTPVVEGRAP